MKKLLLMLMMLAMSIPIWAGGQNAPSRADGEPGELYLLGTANGAISWAPTGPQFTYDAVNDKFYLDVYFKGGNSDAYTDPAYGYFSLTTKVSANWSEIDGYRYGAEYNQYWVENGSTATLYPNRNDNAFKLAPGVYHIEVPGDLSSMSVTKYNLTLTFDPAAGATVEQGQVVTIGSNLTDWLNTINPAEVNNMSFSNTTNNWASQDGDNTAVIQSEGNVTVKAKLDLGYIHVEGEATYDAISDLYILGTANGQNAWQPYGPQFTYDPSTQMYTMDVYFSGTNVTAADEGFGYFSLTTVISDPANPDWGDIPSSARYNAEYNDVPITDLAYNQSTTKALYQTNPDWCFKIDPGVYTITVNKNKTEMTVTKKELALTFTPPSGTVQANTEVTITSNLYDLIHAINPDEQSTVNFRNKLNNGDWDNDNTAMITAEGTTTTITAEANLDYIVVPGTASYTIAQPTEYSIMTALYPSEGGSIDVASTAEAGETVTFTVTSNIGYLLTSVKVVQANTTVETPVTDNGDGTYSFVMPSADVVIRVVYSHNAHHLHTQCIPAEGGRINIQGSENASYYVNYSAWFSIVVNEGYDFESVVAINEATGDTVPLKKESVNLLRYKIEDFPDANVMVTAYFVPHAFKISTASDPSHAGSISLLGNAEDGKEAAGGTITFRVGEPELGFSYSSVDVTIDGSGEMVTPVTDNGDGTYSFVMPEGDVTITAHYVEDAVIFRLVTSREQIVEGKTYTFITQEYNKSIKYLEGKYSQLSFDRTQPILEWVTPDKRRVKVGGLTAFFQTKNVADTMFWSEPYKVLSLTNKGRNVGGEDLPTSPLAYYLTLTDRGPDASLESVANRFIVSVDGNSAYVIKSRGMGTYWRNQLGYYEDLDEFRYFVDDASLSSDVKNVWLYKMCEPYQITTVCEPDVFGQVSLSGEVSGMTALDGSNIIVTPTPADGFALQTLTVTVDATGEEVRVVNNGDGTFSFEMPIGDVTVTAVFAAGYAISTVCVPANGGAITVANMADDDDMVDFTVTPYPDFVLTSVIVTIDGQDQIIELTHGDEGAYSFVMPEAPVTITANFERDGYILKRVTRLEEVIEGKTYTILEASANKVLDKVTPSASPYYTSTDIVGWMVPDKTLVKVDDRACFFSFEDITLNTYGYGLFKDAYLKTDGGYIGYTPSPNPYQGPYADNYEDGYLTLMPNKEDAKMFSTKFGSLDYSLQCEYDLATNYDLYYNSAPAIYYDRELEIFKVIRLTSISVFLYRIAEPYYISLKCEPDGCGTMELTSGNIGNTAIEGSIVTVTPNPAQGYATTSVTLLNEDTDEIIEATLNVDGSYSFVMPTGNVTVTAHFAPGYGITTICDPVESGVITCRKNACAGDNVDFTVLENPSYAFTGVTVTYLDENNQQVTVEIQENDLGNFSFVMPDAAVTITASFAPHYYMITSIVNPDEGGYIECWGDEGHEIFSITDVLYEAGSTVGFSINTESGYTLEGVVVTIDGTDHEIVPIEQLDFYVDEETVKTHAEYMFEMPESNVTITANLKLNTPLRFIEEQTSFIKNETEVTVTDELIGTWAAQQYVWAKDQERSNEYYEMSQDGNVVDYIRTNLRWQTRDWDQSNWVMLDFSEIPDFDWNTVEGREMMNKFVDHKIKAGTIKGTYYCNGNSYDESAVAQLIGKTNHRIVLSKLPEFIEPEDELGYPGYIPDPREEEDIDYRYNQYMSANFLCDNLKPEGVNFYFENIDDAWVLEDEYGCYYAPLEAYDHNIFFMKPKNQEVAHVWGVWAGTMRLWDYQEDGGIVKDMFETYIPNASVTPHLNTYGIPGAFAIEHWDFNRLPSPDENPVYGKPGVDGDPQDALHIGDAYLFHIAIQYDVTDEDEPYIEPVKAPAVRPKKIKEAQAPQVTEYPPSLFYRIYPLDLGGHSGSYTSVYELSSPSSTEIDSIRYYNVVGQESSEPFDGVNIRVIRYKDGSIRSMKIMK